jgi:hypothetical protein
VVAELLSLGRIMRSKASTRTIVDYVDLKATEDRIRKRWPASAGSYEVWLRYDKAVRRVLGRYGKVGWGDDVDFYHSGDWFHELDDGFALLSPATLAAFSTAGLHDLQMVVSKHHPDAMLSFGGELGTPIDGLEFLFTSSKILLAWYENTAATCRRKLKKAGIEVE